LIGDAILDNPNLYPGFVNLIRIYKVTAGRSNVDIINQQNVWTEVGLLLDCGSSRSDHHIPLSFIVALHPCFWSGVNDRTKRNSKPLGYELADAN
jgi:hypothetical protein